MSAIPPGTIIAGDFRVLRPLAAGGMGAVYVALQLSTNRERALKVMLGELTGRDDLKSRFVQEATIGSQIASDHAVEVVAAGIDPASGAPWLAMELLDGEDLATVLERGGAMPPGRVLDLFEQVTHAVGAAHQKGIVHRDLKPENIFLARSRRADGSFTVKVLDFGIAKLISVAKSSATAAIGTPLWMAPEQTQPSHAIAPSCDVWALGLIAFSALTGKLYWKTAGDPNASSMMVLREVAFEPIVPASHRAHELGAAPVPPGFDAWFARCVDRDPAARFPDAAAMQAQLRPLLAAAGAGPAAGASPTGPTYAVTGAAQPSWGGPQASSMGYAGSGIAPTPMPMYGTSQPGSPATSNVTVPPVVPAQTGGEQFPLRPLPPPPAATRARKSPVALYAGVGLLGVALTIGAIVVATSGGGGKRRDRDARTADSGRRVAPPPATVPPIQAEQPPLPETPFAALQPWKGSYLCRQGPTALTLKIESVAGRVVDAIFDFQATGARGSFRLRGTYEPATRKLLFIPGAWIKRPPQYETVGMDGTVSADGTLYAGNITNPACSTFSVRLEGVPQATRPAPPPALAPAAPPPPAAPAPPPASKPAYGSP